jgi:hypothetical protein
LSFFSSPREGEIPIPSANDDVNTSKDNGDATIEMLVIGEEKLD